MNNIIEIKLKIDKRDDRYKITCFVPNNVEGKAIFVADEAVTRILNKSSLIETWITTFESRFDSDLQQVGRELHSLFFQPFSTLDATINRAVSENQFILINIQTIDHCISSLPWEILFFPEHGFIGIESRFQLIRTGENRVTSGEELSPGPLRVLFMACSPDGLKPLLDYEHEEEIVLKAVAEMKRKREIEIDIAESGTLEELERLLGNKEYHVIHISGHGHYDEARNSGYLSMEYENGTHRSVNASEFADALIGKNSVQLLFLSACETGKETSQKTGLARLLTSRGIPMVIAMNYSVTDIAAIELTSSFYKHLTLKKSVCQAFQAARKEYDLLGYGNFQWAIPAIYGRGEKSAIVDWQKPIRPIVEKPVTAIIYGKVQHLVKGFVGRRKEQREYVRQFRDSDPPALCLIGAGGIGKSTLASRITDKFNHDGFIVVPLFGEMTLDVFIHEVQKSLVSAKEKEHIEYLRDLSDNNDKFSYILTNIMVSCHLIFLFDNFEDNLRQSEEFKTFKNEYWEASFKTLIGHLSNTDSKVLITCRYSLPGISRSLVKQVPLKELSFAEMLKMIVYSMEFNQVTLSQAKEIYEVLGGNPKALVDLREILSKTPLIWEEIKIKLEEVAYDMRDFQLFEMLYSFLETDEKAFFRRISVFRKAVGLDGLRRQISKESNLDKYLKTLSDYGLVQEFKDEGNLSYLIHPLNRGFVKEEWWEKDEKENAHEVAAQYYPDHQAFSIGNLIEVSFHLQQAKHYNKMAQMINNHTTRLITWGNWDECMYLNNCIINENERLDKKFLIHAYNNIGGIYSNKGDLDKAMEYHLKSESMCIEMGNDNILGTIYNNIGEVYRKKGVWDIAIVYYLKSETFHNKVGHKAELGSTYNNIGLIYTNKGEWDKAIVYYTKSEKIDLETGNKTSLGVTYNNIGLVYDYKGFWQKALEFYSKSVAIRKQIGDKPGLGITYMNLGGVFSRQGFWDKAMEYYLESKKISEEFGDKAVLGSINNSIGEIYRRKGEWDKAMEYYRISEEILLEVGDRVSLGSTYCNIGLIYSNKGEWSKAMEFYLRSELIRKEVGDKFGLGTLYNNIGGIHFSKGEWDKALVYYLRSEAIYMEVGEKIGLGNLNNNIGRIYDNKGELDKALEYYLKSETILKEAGGIAELSLTYNNIGGIYTSKGELHNALEYYLKSESICIKIGDNASLGALYNNIGGIFDKTGELAKALGYYLKSEKMNMELGNKTSLGVTYNNIGGIYRKKGEWDKALKFYLKSETILKEVGFSGALVPTYFNIGTGFKDNGDSLRGNNYIIIAWFIALKYSMIGDLSQMSWALDPIIKELGQDKFMEEGQKLYNQMINQKYKP